MTVPGDCRERELQLRGKIFGDGFGVSTQGRERADGAAKLQREATLLCFEEAFAMA